MNSLSPISGFILLASLVSITATAQPAPAAAGTPAAAPNTDLRMLRLKLSAGDLPSAESILESHLTETGEDGDYVVGVAWLARGAALVGDWNAASAYAKQARQLAAVKLKTPGDYESEHEAVYALGTAIEVEAQVLVAAGKHHEALRFLDANEQSQTALNAPFNLRARIWKRRNQIDLVDKKAPPFRIDDHVGAEVPTLASLRGKPAVLFFWWEACGDCKMQAASFRRVVEKYRKMGVGFVGVTRFYQKPEEHAAEMGRIEKAWAETYGLADKVPVLISDEAMLRYGVSATPTFAILAPAGTVRFYSPTRLTEARLSAELDKSLR